MAERNPAKKNTQKSAKTSTATGGKCRFFEAVGPFVHDIDEMRHYQAMLSSKA